MTRTTTALTQIDAISKALTEATDLRQVRRIKDDLDLLRMYVSKARLGFDARQQVAEMQLRCDRRAGEMLVGLQDAGGRRGRGGDSTKRAAARLVDLGVEQWESVRWRAIAGIDPEAFEAYIVGRHEAHEEITISGLVNGPAGFTGFSSETDEWYSPDVVIDASVAVLGQIDLDPCAEPPHSTTREWNIPAARHFTADDDGLGRPWSGRVYMNPPYGDALPFWIAKVREEYEEQNISHAVVLTAARTDTAWFRMLRDFSVCFVAGRLRFRTPDSRDDRPGQSSPFPSAVFALGVNQRVFLKVFGQMGDVYARVG